MPSQRALRNYAEMYRRLARHSPRFGPVDEYRGGGGHLRLRDLDIELSFDGPTIHVTRTGVGTDVWMPSDEAQFTTTSAPRAIAYIEALVARMDAGLDGCVPC